jgi:glycerol-3-phosphate cytidylyltransferase
MTIKVLTSGVFDILHSGHFNLLRKAKKKGHLIVCLQSDKGALQSFKKTTLNYKERYLELKSLALADKIIKYHSTNDIKKIILKENIDAIIQGDDYHLTGDRKDLVDFLNKKKIKLILYSRTKNISSSIIKNKILFLTKEYLSSIKLKILRTEELSQYEKFSKTKVTKLYSSLKKKKIIHNPITVVNYKKKNIVIDGNNRLEALKLLKYKFVPCLIFDYSDINLISNIFFFDKKNKLISRVSELFPAKYKYKKSFQKFSRDDIYNLISNNKKISSGLTFHLQPYYVINLNINLRHLQKNFNIRRFISLKLKKKNIRSYYNAVINFND